MRIGRPSPCLLACCSSPWLRDAAAHLFLRAMRAEMLNNNNHNNNLKKKIHHQWGEASEKPMGGCKKSKASSPLLHSTPRARCVWHKGKEHKGVMTLLFGFVFFPPLTSPTKPRDERALCDEPKGRARGRAKGKRKALLLALVSPHWSILSSTNGFYFSPLTPQATLVATQREGRARGRKALPL